MVNRNVAWGFFLVSLVATVAVGCASTPDDSPASTSVRRVFLSKTAQEPRGYSYQSDMGLGTPTDRFEAELDRGYLYIVFNDNKDHTAQFRVTDTETGRTHINTAVAQVTGSPTQVGFRFSRLWFQIAGRLRPGNYVLELTIDDRPAGKYRFVVVSAQ